ITRDASFRARDAFISPSAAITYTRMKREVMFYGEFILALSSFTSLISTRSTLMPQSSVIHFHKGISAWQNEENSWRSRKNHEFSSFK
uniref:Uncharacterized protein n=1 Tax=Labrus bergylta TaxID=56723 RepID=A0A3Q3FAR2_9LABR